MRLNLISTCGRCPTLAAAATCLAVSAPAPSAPQAPSSFGGSETLERRVALMGTWLELEITAADRATALAASADVVAALERTEARLSTWREDSELSHLNRKPVGEAFLMSAELARDLESIRPFWLETGGAFDPGIGALVRMWGLRSEGPLPPAAQDIARALEDGGFASLEIHGRHAVRRGEVEIEEGAFGKGLGLDAACAALRESGASRAVLDLGGQIALFGEGPFTLAVAHPIERDRNAVEICIDGGSLATSGNSERAVSSGGETIGHLLDPRTGRPAPDFGSLTVWAETATAADCLSTGLYVLGPAAAIEYAERTQGVEVLVLETSDGPAISMRASSGFHEHCRALPALIAGAGAAVDPIGTNNVREKE